MRRASYLVLAAASSPALARPLTGGAAPNISALRVVLALILCLAAAFAVILLLRKRLGTSMPAGPDGGFSALLRQDRRIAVLEARRLSAHADICLVRCDGTEYLLLCGPAGTEVLSRTPTPGEGSE